MGEREKRERKRENEKEKRKKRDGIIKDENETPFGTEMV